MEPRTTDVDIPIVTHAGATIGEDGPHPQIRPDGQNKVPFDIATEKETFFGAWDAITKNLDKSPIIEMPPSFDSTLEAGASR